MKTIIFLSFFILISCKNTEVLEIETNDKTTTIKSEDTMVNYLMEKNSVPDLQCKMITRIKYKSSQEMIDEVEEKGFDINCKDEFVYSFVMLALLDKKIELVHYLLERDVDLSTIVKKENIAHYHCKWNWDEKWDAELMSQLIKKGVDIHLSDEAGNQPLWYAAIKNRGFGRTLDLVEVLLKAGADMHHKNNVNKTPKMIAESLNDTELLKLFNKYDDK